MNETNPNAKFACELVTFPEIEHTYCNELRLLLLNNVVIIRLLHMTSLMVTLLHIVSIGLFYESRDWPTKVLRG